MVKSSQVTNCNRSKVIYKCSNLKIGRTVYYSLSNEIDVAHSLDDDAFWINPFRKITNKGVKKNIGKFPSLKMKRNIWYESLLEGDYVELLEFDIEVIRFKEQPFRIIYVYEGRKYRYTPDFLVQRKSKLQVVEVKPEEKANTPQNLLRYRIISSICRAYGFEFIVVTEKLIRIEPLLRNVKILWRYARTTIHPLHQIYCQEFLISRPGISLQELAAALAHHGVTLQILYSLIYWGCLSVDLNNPLTAESIVQFAGVLTNRKVVVTNAGI